MKIKEFVSPTLIKVIIFLIISQVFVPFIFYYSDNPNSLGITLFPSSRSCGEGNVGISTCMPPREITMGSVLTYILDYSFFGVRMGHISYLFLIVGLIISYLISCMLVFSCGKLMKKEKMGWKNLPAWLKGGIIGLIIGILIIFGSYLYQLWLESTRQGYILLATVFEKPNPIMILIFFPFVIAAIISSLIGLKGTSLIFKLPYESLFISFLGLTIYFIIGALVGSIIQKIVKK